MQTTPSILRAVALATWKREDHRPEPFPRLVRSSQKASLPAGGKERRVRLVALWLIVLFVSAAAPARADRTSPSDAAMVALCRLWNAVRFFHPGLAGETDAGWDDALLPAIAAVELDPAALRDAARAMVATLHDPTTTLDTARPPGPTASPTAEDRDGIRIVHLNGYPDASSGDAYRKALAAALTVPAGDRAMVVDLRIPGSFSFDQVDWLQTAWSQVPFASHLVTTQLSMPRIAQRSYVGFPSESGTTSGDYHEGRETTAGGRSIAPAPDARRVPTAFVVDAGANLPDEALALERAGSAAVFTADGAPGIVPGDSVSLDAGDGLTVVLRMTAPLDEPGVRDGGLAAALDWARSPSAASGAAPAAVGRPIEQRFAATTLPDEEHRVLAAFRMWGTIAYFDPYKQSMHDDWNAALATGVRDVRSASSPLAYQLALMKMYAHIHDTHGFMTVPAVREAYASTPAFLARDVEGLPTIVRVDPAAAKRDGFAVGDVIEAVDGEPVAARAARLLPYLAASTEQSAHELLDTGVGFPALFAGPSGSTATLRLRQADGSTRDVRTPRVAPERALNARTRPVVDVLAGNVGYVDLQRLNPGDVDAAVARLAKTTAIVFDLRGYPRGTAWPLAPHFTATTVRAALFRTPVRRTPLSGTAGQPYEYLDETRDFYQLIAPAAPRLTQPLVVVIDPRAISQAEHTALYFAAAGHARFVGEPTMGANGDVTQFLLPGGIVANFSGQAVLHPDGMPLQRVGIIPDVRCSQTLRGVRAGDDELLAAGVREALRLSHEDAGTQRTALGAERAAERADALAQQQPQPVAIVAVPADAAPLPDGYAAQGDGYEGGHDAAVRHADGRTIVLRAKTTRSSAFGMYAESLPLDAYRGKRVRVSGYLRSANAASASFWLRVDGPDGHAQSFDNMNDRALSGTRVWTPFAIVLDVPTNAQGMVGGLLLQGDGTVWADDLRIDVVDARVRTTGSF